MSEATRRVVSWVSCGAASAAASKLMCVEADKDPTLDLVLARIYVPEEDPDNDRFARDLEPWLGRPIRVLRSDEFASCEDVWATRRYMSGPKGAPCTAEMKKAVRWAFEREWWPTHQVFGFTADKREITRARNFREDNPEVRVLTPLIDANLTKDDCYALVQRAGLTLPRMYRLGYDNANCVGCVKAQSPAYWNRVRQTHPEVFARRAVMSRRIGARLVKLTRGTRERIFLDELDPADLSEDDTPTWDCGIACARVEAALGGAAVPAANLL